MNWKQWSFGIVVLGSGGTAVAGRRGFGCANGERFFVSKPIADGT